MKKGFTLIELLAVVVILAVIALIAIPIVVSLINDSTYSTETISAKSYANAVIETIMKESLDSKKYFEPDKCIINNKGNVTCDGVDLKIVAEGEKPISGFLEFEEGSLVDAHIEFKDASIVMSAAGELVNLNNDLVCVRATNENVTTGNVPSGNFLPGDEYICEVKGDTKYHFFVLSTEGDNINLILDRNINSDGTLVTKRILFSDTAKVYNIVPWISAEDYGDNNVTGEDCDYVACSNLPPITAIKFINEATKDWKNINNLNETYVDEKNKYGEIKLTGKARLPRLSEVKEAGCVDKDLTGDDEKGSCPLWLVNHLSSSGYVTGEKVINFDKVFGYWTLSSGYTKSAHTVNYESLAATITVYLTNNSGIRPVISVPKTDIY